MINYDDIKNKLKILTKKDKDKSDKFGEVFTSPNLITNMLSLIVEDFWKCTTNKILDNSVGYGNFTIYIIEKLMNNLPIEDEYLRYKHIMENMLYFCDIQEESYNMFNELFKVEDIQINFEVCDFLDYKTDIVFDLCIGNPPYNNKRSNNTNGNILWDKFVKKSYDISNRLCLVHPTIWRKPYKKGSKIYDILSLYKQNNLKYLNINSVIDGKKEFYSGTSFDYYYLDKTTDYNKTTIIDEENNELLLDIRNVNFIPNKNINFVYSFTNKKFNVIFDSMYHAIRPYISKIKDIVYCYELIHSTPKSGIVKRYSSINNKGHFGIPKVIIGEGGVDSLIVDYNGDYGMTQGAMGIVDKVENLDNIKEFFLSDNFKKIRESCRWSNFRIDSNLIKEIGI